MRNETRRTLRALNNDMQTLQRRTRAAQRDMARFNRTNTITSRGVQRTTRSTRGLISQMSRLRTVVGFAVLALGALGVGFGFRSVVREFADFEEALIGVQKTTDISGDALAQFGEDIQRISRQIPVAADEMLLIAERAGALGIEGSANLLKFTRTIAELGLATDLASEEAAFALARIAALTDLPTDQIDRLGSAIVEVGNNFSTTEREIVEVARRIATGTAAFDIAAQEVIGIATAIATFGVQAEQAGTVVQRTFLKIDEAIREGGRGLEVLASISRVTIQEFIDNFRRAPAEAFADFIQGLGDLKDAGVSVAATLEQVDEQLGRIRVVNVLTTLAAKSEITARAIETANRAFRENSALTLEVFRRTQSFTSQMTLVAGAVNEAAVVIGRELAPEILLITRRFKDFILEAKDSGRIREVAEEIAEGFRNTIEALREFGASVGPIFKVIGSAVLILADNMNILVFAFQTFIVLKIVGFVTGLAGAFIGMEAATIRMNARLALTSPLLVTAKGAMVGLGVATGTAGRAAFFAASAFKLLGRVILIGLVVEVLIKAVEVWGQLNMQLREGITGFDAFGNLVQAVGENIIQKFIALVGIAKDFFDILIKIATLNFGGLEAELDSLGRNLEQFNQSIFIGVNRRAADLTLAQIREVRQAADDTLDALLNMGEQGQRGLEGLTGSFSLSQLGLGEGGDNTITLPPAALDDSFISALQAIVSEFRPVIDATVAQAEAVRVLNQALGLSNSALAQFGLTQEEVAGILADVNAQVIESLTLFDQENMKLDERVSLLGLDRIARQNEIELQRILNADRENAIRLTAEEIALLRERIVVVNAAESAERFQLVLDQRLRGLVLERGLIGATNDERRDAVLIDNLRRQGELLGIDNLNERLRLVREELRLLREAQASFDGSVFEGLKAGLESFQDSAANLNEQFKQFGESTLQETSDALTEFVETGKADIAGFVDFILKELQKIASKQIISAIAGAFFGGGGLGGKGGGLLSSALAFGNSGGLLGSLFSKGGMVGRDGQPAILPADAFKNAKRMQFGGPVSGTDSIPILAAKGETVLNADATEFLRRALEGRSAGTLNPGVNNSGRGGSQQRTRNINVDAKIIVEGVTDAQSFERGAGNIAADFALQLQNSLRRNG